MSITDLIAFHQATFGLFNVQAGRIWVKTQWTLDFLCRWHCRDHSACHLDLRFNGLTAPSKLAHDFLLVKSKSLFPILVFFGQHRVSPTAGDKMRFQDMCGNGGREQTPRGHLGLVDFKINLSFFTMATGQACQVNLGRHISIVLKCQGKDLFLLCYFVSYTKCS